MQNSKGEVQAVSDDFHLTIQQFGTAGVEGHADALCVLPNNVVHQKFYLFLWFWLFAITIVTLLHQLYRSTWILIGRGSVFCLYVHNAITGSASCQFQHSECSSLKLGGHVRTLSLSCISAISISTPIDFKGLYLLGPGRPSAGWA